MTGSSGTQDKTGTKKSGKKYVIGQSKCALRVKTCVSYSNDPKRQPLQRGLLITNYPRPPVLWKPVSRL